jgi:hypothetical protein
MEIAIKKALANALPTAPAETAEGAPVAGTSAATTATKRSTGTRALKQKPTSNTGKAAKNKRKSAEAKTSVTDTVKEPRTPRVTVLAFEPSAELLVARQGVALLIRKNADNTFAIGQGLSDLQPQVPEKAWGKFVKPLGLTTRTAWNYMSVARNLTSYRKELVDADIGPTALYQLARGPGDVVEAVINAYLAGERLGVAAIKRMIDDALGIKAKPKADGGIAGLRRVALEKLRTDEAALQALAKRLLGVLTDTVKTLDEGKGVRKGVLAAEVAGDAAKATLILESLMRPTDHNHWSTAESKAPSWGHAKSVLIALANPVRWPKKPDFEPWLVETVIPTLRFIVYGDPLRPGIEADAVQMDDQPIEVSAIVAQPAGVGEGEAAFVDDKMRSGVPSPEELAAEIYATHPMSLDEQSSLLVRLRQHAETRERLLADIDLDDDEPEVTPVDQERAYEPAG